MHSATDVRHVSVTGDVSIPGPNPSVWGGASGCGLDRLREAVARANWLGQIGATPGLFAGPAQSAERGMSA